MLFHASLHIRAYGLIADWYRRVSAVENPTVRSKYLEVGLRKPLGYTANLQDMFDSLDVGFEMVLTAGSISGQSNINILLASPKDKRNVGPCLT